MGWWGVCPSSWQPKSSSLPLLVVNANCIQQRGWKTPSFLPCRLWDMAPGEGTRCFPRASTPALRLCGPGGRAEGVPQISTHSPRPMHLSSPRRAVGIKDWVWPRPCQGSSSRGPGQSLPGQETFLSTLLPCPDPCWGHWAAPKNAGEKKMLAQACPGGCEIK